MKTLILTTLAATTLASTASARQPQIVDHYTEVRTCTGGQSNAVSGAIGGAILGGILGEVLGGDSSHRNAFAGAGALIGSNNASKPSPRRCTTRDEYDYSTIRFKHNGRHITLEFQR